MKLAKIATVAATLGLLATPAFAHIDCDGVYQLSLTADEHCPDPAAVPPGGAAAGAGAAGTPLLGGLTAGTAVAGAVTLAVVIAAITNDGDGPIGTTVTSTTGTTD